MKPVSGEFLKGGSLSVDRPIEEKAPLVLTTYFICNQYDIKRGVLYKRFQNDGSKPKPKEHVRTQIQIAAIVQLV